MRIKKSLAHIHPYPVAAASRRGFIRLDMNENNWGCAPGVMRAIHRVQPVDLALYPEYARIRRRLAAEHLLADSSVCITNGGDEAIRAAMAAFVEPNDEVIIPQPTFSIYPLAASLQLAKITPVPYGKNFAFPGRELLMRITRQTRMVVIVSPNNPTGTVIGGSDLKRILGRMRHGLVLLDQTYQRFGGDDFSPLVSSHENLVVLHSFSKAFGLAGLRIGYALAADETIAAMHKVLPPFPVNSLAVLAAEKAMQARRHTERTIAWIKKERELLRRRLQCQDIPVHDSQGSFLLANFGPDCGRILSELRQRKILVKGFIGDPRLDGFARISIGRPEENRLLLRSLKEILHEIRSEKKRGVK